MSETNGFFLQEIPVRFFFFDSDLRQIMCPFG